MTIGENIKLYRKHRGLTQVELAERSKMSRSYIADIERNRYNPSVDTLTAIANALDIPVSAILEGPDKSLEPADNEELLADLFTEIREVAEGTYMHPKFPNHIIKSIELESEAIRRIHQVEFEFTPDDIMRVCREVDDMDFTIEIIEMLKRAIANSTSINVPKWATSKDKRDFKKMLEEDGELMFDGVPIDDEDREKIKRVLEALFWDAKERNKRIKPKND